MTSPRRVPSLTGIRFLAAVYVFTFHFGAGALDRAGVPAPLRTFAHNGYFGVTLFFILSGFILAHAHPEPITGTPRLGQFFLSRFARIYPVYLVALLATLPLVGGLTRAQAVATLAGVQSWTSASFHAPTVWLMPAWTLSVEFFFYLTFPFLLSFCRRLALTPLALLLLLDAAFLVYGGVTDLHPGLEAGEGVPDWLAILPLPIGRYGEFAFGVMLFCSIERIKPVIPAGFTAGCALLLVLLLASTSQPQLMGLASILTGLLIGGLYLSDGGLNRLLGNPPMRMLGNASYALYLLQMAGHGAAVAWLPEPLGRALALPLTVLAALLVLRWIEEPARKAILGHRPVTVQT